jgi:hypothetical protein
MRTLMLIGLCAGLMAATMGGCTVNVPNALVTADTQIVDAVGSIQTQDPRAAPLPSGLVAQGDVIVLDPHVDVITNIETQIIVQDVPDITLIGFDNATGFDMYLRYAVDGEDQAVLVLDGEALLLEYPCATTIELLSEDHFDPVTGVLVESFDLGAEAFTRPADFDCGDTFVLTFDPDQITVNTVISL